MTHKLLSSLTASLLIATLGLPISTSAKTPDVGAPDQDSEAANQPASAVKSVSSAEEAASPLIQDDVAKSGKQSNEVVKVGEQQSQTTTQTASETIAKVESHSIDGKEAAILYVRGLPILSFLGAKPNSPDGVKVGTQAKPAFDGGSKLKSLDARVPKYSLTSIVRSSQALLPSPANAPSLELLNDPAASADPVWKASMIAARINQLYRDGIKASDITVVRDSSRNLAQRDRFVIKLGKLDIASVDQTVPLLVSSGSLEQEVLQATNRLRRALGDADPLQAIVQPDANGGTTFALGPIRMRLTGWASWYGPGFDGNPSASGERFNQNALTAAHRTLPFGTRVLVTNLDTGQSVVVRINDRGPFHGNRIIDLSTGAARIIGLVQAGIARVRLDVLDPNSAAVSN